MSAAGEPKPTIEVAEGSGVCFGVKRALRLAEKALEAGEAVYCLGPLIHNPQEVDRLAGRGFRVIESLEEAASGGTLLVRSHGLAPAVVAEAKALGLHIIDATCPLVRRVQTLATDLEGDGYQVIVAGDAAHPEVRAIQGHAPKAVVVSAPEALEGLALAGRVALVAQTTFSPEVFRRMAAELVMRVADEVRVVKTICAATVERQRATASLADRVDVMFVIGGRNSANTNRLAELCAACDVPTYHVEVADEVRPEMVAGRPRVGVAAGASTPQWIIDAVRERIRALQSGRGQGNL
ncbi:MAG: 4-hydroxy-3-methylbut-2-enyl diphosphate reductase [Planctomycetes bacterium]|nr:4-hydroxy-3-methylbut-2-enyl diphosphate reductase [Planctomycetota bacterium]